MRTKAIDFILWFSISAFLSGVSYDNHWYGTAWGCGVISACLLLSGIGTACIRDGWD